MKQSTLVIMDIIILIKHNVNYLLIVIEYVIKKGNFNQCKSYCYTEDGNIDKCDNDGNTKAKDGMKNCKNLYYLKYNSDLPNCKYNCFTQKGKLENAHQIVLL